MAAKKTQQAPEEGNKIKDPANWTTGDEPATGAQKSYMQTLAEEAGEEVETDVTKAEASEKIEELRHATGRDQTPAATKGGKAKPGKKS